MGQLIEVHLTKSQIDDLLMGRLLAVDLEIKIILKNVESNSGQITSVPAKPSPTPTLSQSMNPQNLEEIPHAEY